MDGCSYCPYVLPTIDFVGGSTQDLLFHVYFHSVKNPFDLTGCSGRFALVNYLNKNGAPIFTKNMTVESGADDFDNILTVTLEPSDTADLAGKYIYQISLKDGDGDVEIPKQGIMYITKNIDQGFVS